MSTAASNLAVLVTAVAATLLVPTTQASDAPASHTIHGAQPNEATGPTPYPGRADDWPGRGVVRLFEWMAEQRKQFWRERAHKQHSIVFAGDSLTANWRDMPGDFGPRVANRGIGGDVSRGLLFRFREDILALNPQAVVILIGTNDLTARQRAADTLSNIDAMLQLRNTLRASSPVILCTVPPSASARAPVDAMQRARLNDGLHELAARHDGVVVVDLFKAVAAADGSPIPEFFKSDLLHLSSRGYAQWRDLLLPALRDLRLQSPRPVSE